MKSLGKAPTRGARISAVRDYARKMGFHIPGILVPYRSTLDASPNRIVASRFSKKALAGPKGPSPYGKRAGNRPGGPAPFGYGAAARPGRVRFRPIPAFSRATQRRRFAQ